MLYDITNKKSLNDLYDWIKIITSTPNSPRTKLLIEHKKDLEEQRAVSRKDAEELHKTYNFQGKIIGTSAITGENVEEAFQMLGREIIKNSLRKCPNCGKLYPLELKFCQYCGTRHF